MVVVVVVIMVVVDGKGAFICEDLCIRIIYNLWVFVFFFSRELLYHTTNMVAMFLDGGEGGVGGEGEEGEEGERTHKHERTAHRHSCDLSCQQMFFDV